MGAFWTGRSRFRKDFGAGSGASSRASSEFRKRCRSKRRFGIFAEIAMAYVMVTCRWSVMLTCKHSVMLTCCVCWHANMLLCLDAEVSRWRVVYDGAFGHANVLTRYADMLTCWHGGTATCFKLTSCWYADTGQLQYWHVVMLRC